MSEENASHGEEGGAVSMARLLKVLIPIALIALAVRYTLPSFEQAAQQELESNMLTKLLGKAEAAVTEGIEFADSDGDLLCDFPADDACVTPEKLVFTYVGGPEEVDESQTWADLMSALSEATGVPVEYKHYAAAKDRIAALVAGELHVAGLNTGAVPMAVKAAGFHPVCTQGKEDGSFGYKMKLLAADKSIKDVSQLADKRLAFTTPDSNSGFKAALIYLMDEPKLLPERDYEWGFTFGHEASVQGLVSGDHDAAPVASDILERMVNDGEVTEDAFTVVYESERFPPATIGFAYNLTPELREKLAEALTGFAWPGTSVEAKYGSSGATAFVPVNYKDDWANIRRINEAVADAKATK